MNEKTERTTLVFASEIDYESVSTLIDLLEENAHKKIDLYFSSSGGGVSSGELLIDYFNFRKLDLTLIANWSINSTAFSVFFKSDCVNRRIMPNTHSTIHLCRRDISTIDLNRQESYEKFLIDDVDRQNEKDINWFRELGISKDKIDIIKSGKDVMLDYEDLVELL